MAKLTLWYSVGNGGDGSAYPRWFESERLTEMDQDLMEEGWGECCNGSITVEGENMKVVGTRVTTAEEFIKNTLDHIINYKGGYYSKGTKKKAQEYKDELLNEMDANNFNGGNIKWYGKDSVDERIKKYNDFK
jgi:hypothetical protein